MTIKEYLKSRDSEIYNKAVSEGKTYTELSREYNLSSPRIGQILNRVNQMYQFREMYGEDIPTGIAKRLFAHGIESLDEAKAMGKDITQFSQIGPHIYAIIQRL
jgi:hypothetical protein